MRVSKGVSMSCHMATAIACGGCPSLEDDDRWFFEFMDGHFWGWALRGEMRLVVSEVEIYQDDHEERGVFMWWEVEQAN